LCPINLLELTCLNLALNSKWLIIISPHKNPIIQNDFGWNLKTNYKIDRVHVRIYKQNFDSSSLKISGISSTIRN